MASAILTETRSGDRHQIHLLGGEAIDGQHVTVWCVGPWRPYMKGHYLSDLLECVRANSERPETGFATIHGKSSSGPLQAVVMFDDPERLIRHDA